MIGPTYEALKARHSAALKEAKAIEADPVYQMGEKARIDALTKAAWAMPETTNEERSAKRAALHNVGIDCIGSILIEKAAG